MTLKVVNLIEKHRINVMSLSRDPTNLGAKALLESKGLELPILTVLTGPDIAVGIAWDFALEGDDIWATAVVSKLVLDKFQGKIHAELLAGLNLGSVEPHAIIFTTLDRGALAIMLRELDRKNES